MPAAEHHLVAEQGSTFDFDLEFLDVNDNVINLSTGFTVRMMIRTSFDGDVIFDSDTADGTVVLAGAAPNIKISAEAAVTAGWQERKKSQYDVELTTAATGRVERLIEGTVEITPNVTK